MMEKILLVLLPLTLLVIVAYLVWGYDQELSNRPKLTECEQAMLDIKESRSYLGEQAAINYYRLLMEQGKCK